MFDQLKNIKVYHCLFIAFVASCMCAFFADNKPCTETNVSFYIVLSIIFFLLSGIAFRFKSLPSEFKSYSTDEKIHISLMIVFTLLVFYFFSDKVAWQDDITFSNYIINKTLHQFLFERYEQWSSRCVIEATLVAMLQSSLYVWKTISTILVTICTECAISLFLSKKNIKYCFIPYLLVLLTIPTITLTDAGWIATTTNYLWPLTSFMALAIIIKKIFNEEKIGLFEKAQASVLTIYAANIEALVLTIIGIIVVLFVYKAFESKTPYYELAKRIDRTVFLVLGISSVLLVLTLLAPGNAIRTTAETSNWFPDFGELGLLDKLKLGIVSTMPFFYANTIYLCNLAYPTNFLMLLLMLFISIKLWKDKNYKVLAMQFMGILIVLFNQVHIIANSFGKQINKCWYVLANTKINQYSDFESIYIYLEILIYLLVGGTLIYGVYIALNKSKKGLLSCIILLAGFCTRLIMGFSPTVYVSGTRTFLFAIAAILIVTLIIIDELIKDEKNKIAITITFVLSMLYVSYLMPEIKTGTEFENCTNIVDISELRKLPIHENSEIRKTFRIDTNNNDYQPEEEDILDLDKDKGMFLVGWAYDIESRSALSSIFAVIGDKCVKVNYGSIRIDVANAFNISKKVGFALKLPHELFMQNNKLIEKITFYAVNSSGEFKYSPFSFKVRHHNLEERQISNNIWETGFHVEYCNDVLQKEGDTRLAFDDKKGSTISGWAIDFANKTKLGAIQVIIGDTTINADYGKERQDVADFFKMSDKELGFTIEIPSEVLNKRKEVTDIGIVLVSPGLDFKYEPITYKIKR